MVLYILASNANMYMFAISADFPLRENPQKRLLMGGPQTPGNAPLAHLTKPVLWGPRRGGCAFCER